MARHSTTPRAASARGVHRVRDTIGGQPLFHVIDSRGATRFELRISGDASPAEATMVEADLYRWLDAIDPPLCLVRDG